VPRSLSWRIGLAFAFLALATWIAIGGALFLVLRSLHTVATTSTLTDVATPLVAQARAELPTAGDVRATLANLRDQVASQGYSVYVVTADGRIVTLDGDPVPADTVRIPPNSGRGATIDGTFRSNGQSYAWVAIVLRNPAGVGPRALILATTDRSSADAVRDLLAALPAVVIVSLLVGGPIAWLISRSVTQPLRRLAAATADLPAGSAAPLPLEGPTEVRDLTARFNAMSEELGHSRQEEADLLANLRHDLRTPLTVIGGFATALTDGTATGDDVGRAARAIGEEAARLEELVGQLGAVERLQSGAPGLRPEAIDAAELLAQAAERFRPAASAAGFEISVVEPLVALAGGAAMAPQPDVTFTADRLAMDRILANLIGNALAALSAGEGAAPPAGPAPASGTATPVRGHVWLAARRLPGGSRGGASMLIQVTDDGPGFPPGATARVFERFYRADPSRARIRGGSGLGLTIVRELARAQGGEAVAENVAPRGARISVMLPVELQPVQPVAQR
jgi:signal transduction histidine kinase